MDLKLKLLVVTELLLVIVVLFVVLSLVSTLPDLPTTIQQDTICLPDKHGKITCGRAPELLRDYLAEATASGYETIKREDEQRQQDFLDENKVRLMSIYDKNFWEMKPAAKLIGKEQPEIRESDIWESMTPIRAWRHGRELYDGTGFERYGIRYRNGRLVVPVSGTYFIYSFLDLYEPCIPATGKPDIKDTSKPIKHGMFKFNILDERERELVSNVQPHMISNNKYFNSYSSYVSSLVDLKAGDEISVKVSNLTYLRYTRGNYFGINLI